MKKLIEQIQRAYPQVYLACHVDHVKAKSNAFRLSARDAAILSHLDDETPETAGRVAAHLGVRPSTFSAAINRLIELGYVKRAPNPHDRRETWLTLTQQGVRAMAAASVLDAARVSALLATMSPAARERAVSGLVELARAARALRVQEATKGPAQ
jgi:DNA-binding MarR family transcriptional regulator